MTPLTVTDPKQIGSFRLINRLGAGAMGIVYTAISKTGARVALKTLDTTRFAPVDLPDVLERFAREARAMKRLKGEALVRVLMANPKAEPAYLVTSLVEGQTLKERLVSGPLSLEQVTVLGLVMAEALEEVHRAKLVHRDVKPGNIILGEHGPVLVDFGLVTADNNDENLTLAGASVGSPATMAPEQALGYGADWAADVHGLGAVLVEAATGHYVYDATGGPKAMMVRIADENVAPDLTKVPEELHGLLEKMLSYSAGTRPAAGEVLRELSAVLVGLSKAGETHAALSAARKRFVASTFVRNQEVPIRPPEPEPTDLGWLVEEIRRDYRRSDLLMEGKH